MPTQELCTENNIIGDPISGSSNHGTVSFSTLHTWYLAFSLMRLNQGFAHGKNLFRDNDSLAPQYVCECIYLTKFKVTRTLCDNKLQAWNSFNTSASKYGHWCHITKPSRRFRRHVRVERTWLNLHYYVRSTLRIQLFPLIMSPCNLACNGIHAPYIQSSEYVDSVPNFSPVQFAIPLIKISVPLVVQKYEVGYNIWITRKQ